MSDAKNVRRAPLSSRAWAYLEELNNHWIGDAIGAAALFVIFWGLMLVAAIFQGMAL